MADMTDNYTNLSKYLNNNDYIVPDAPRSSRRMDFAVNDVIGAPPLEMVFLFESPHVTELCTGIPVTGNAGSYAMSILCPTATQSLGFWVNKHPNAKIAILNVSPVPLQKGAYRNREVLPDVNESEWTILESFRRDGKHTRPPKQAIFETLYNGLADRVKALKMARECMFITCGNFATIFGQELSTRGVLDKLANDPVCVYYPAYGAWNRKGSDERVKNLVDVIDKFRILC